MPLIPEYQKILNKAQGNKKANKVFLDKLKKENPPDLDLVTNEFHDLAFNTIDCLKCANCCTTTGPLIKNRDIDRLAAALQIKSSAFADNFLKIDEDGDYIFKSHPCPFLQHDKLCSVYSSRPDACAQFPHTQQRNIKEKLQITYLNTLICPAVAVVVENLKKHYEKKCAPKLERTF
jgi:Fe-S-cluster containining protein